MLNFVVEKLGGNENSEKGKFIGTWRTHLFNKTLSLFGTYQGPDSVHAGNTRVVTHMQGYSYNPAPTLVVI